MTGHIQHAREQAQLGAAAERLDTLFAMDEYTTDSAITPFARNCFEDIQNTRQGCCYHTKKFACISSAFATALAVPTAALVGGAYYAYQSVTMDNAPYIVGAAAGVIGANRACDAAFGFKPIKKLVDMVGLSIIYLAHKASDMVHNSYTQKEAAQEAFKKDRHVVMVQHLKQNYTGVADELNMRFVDAQKSPEQMYKLKQFVTDLEGKLSLAMQAFAKLGLSPSESGQILDDVALVMGQIENFKFKFKNGSAAEDKKFNANLMCVLSAKAFGEHCLPKDAANHLSVARQNQLGCVHTLKKYIHTVSGGLAAGAIAAVSLPAVALGAASYAHPVTYDYLTQKELQPAIALTSLTLAAPVVYKVAKNIFTSYRHERKEHDDRVEQELELASTNLCNLYHGVADYFSSQRKAAANDSALMSKLQKQARNLLDKLPLAQAKLGAINELQDPKAITAKLANVLAEILQPAKSSCAAAEETAQGPDIKAARAA